MPGYSPAEFLAAMGLAEQMMSQENVEIVREVYDGFGQRDNEMPFGFYAADVEWDVSRYHPLGQFAVYHGHDGVRAMFSDLLAEFRDFEFQVLDLTPAGDHVLVTVGEHGVGRESGAAVDGRHYAVWTLRDGIVTRVCTFLDHDEALKAVKLSDQAMSPDLVECVRDILAAANREDWDAILAH